jgi:REP element-mobilizing transposase RayT
VSGRVDVKKYPRAENLGQPVPRVSKPRAPRMQVPGGTMHVVAAAADFALLLAHLRELVRSYEVTVYAYTLMSNHVHLLMQAPTHEALGRPLRWFMTESARAFHKARGRRGHFWERGATGRVSSRCAGGSTARSWPQTRIIGRTPAIPAGVPGGLWGSPAFMAPYVPRRGRRRIGPMPTQNQEVRP